MADAVVTLCTLVGMIVLLGASCFAVGIAAAVIEQRIEQRKAFARMIVRAADEGGDLLAAERAGKDR